MTVFDAATNRSVETIGVGRTSYVADVMDGTVRAISSGRHASDG